MLESSHLLETVFVLVLFAGYLGLWKLKRRQQRHATGTDPEVFARATAPLQRYIGNAAKVLTFAVVLLVVAHAAGLDLAPVTPWPALSHPALDVAGLALGLLGLGLCALAQRTMGASWRVGIDEQQRTELVTAGMYRLVRNPTYLGLYAMNAGFWLVWPSAGVALFALAFFLVMEVQVRCEEAHLLALHGERYRDYLRGTWRYLPGLY